MQSAAHNRLGRRVRRRIPFTGFWWAIALFYLSLIVVTPLSLAVWLRPGGADSTLGVFLRWIWTVVAAIKVVGGLLPIVIRKLVKKRAKPLPRITLASQWLSLLIAGTSLYAFASHRLEIAVILLYAAGTVTNALRAKLKSEPYHTVTSLLCLVTVASYYLGNSWTASISAAVICLVEAISTLGTLYRPLVNRNLRRALTGKLSRLEYGATALEACPVGGG
jgi:hypothetical protein